MQQERNRLRHGLETTRKVSVTTIDSVLMIVKYSKQYTSLVRNRPNILLLIIANYFISCHKCVIYHPLGFIPDLPKSTIDVSESVYLIK